MVFKDIFECVQVDLIDYPRYKGANSGHQYILVVIDCLSKYAWTRSLTKKTAKRTAEALDSIFGEMPRLPTMMASDKGLEFSPTDPHIKRIVKDKYHLHMFTLQGSIKAGIVERFNRTLKSRLERYFDEKKTHKWVDVLQQFTRNYNHTYHRSIKMAPADVTSDKVPLVLRNVYPNREKWRSCSPKPFKKGDKVRIALVKKPFSKGYQQSKCYLVCSSLTTTNFIN